MIVINLKTILFGSENDRVILLETSRKTLSNKILDLFGKNKEKPNTVPLNTYHVGGPLLRAAASDLYFMRAPYF